MTIINLKVTLYFDHKINAEWEERFRTLYTEKGWDHNTSYDLKCYESMRKQKNGLCLLNNE